MTDVSAPNLCGLFYLDLAASGTFPHLFHTTFYTFALQKVLPRKYKKSFFLDFLNKSEAVHYICSGGDGLVIQDI